MLLWHCILIKIQPSKATVLDSTGSFVLSALRSGVCSGDEFTMVLKMITVLTSGEKMHFENAFADLCSEEQGSFPCIL